MKSKAAVFIMAVGLLLGRSAFGVTQLIQNGNFEAFPTSLDWDISPATTTETGITFGIGVLSMGNVTGPNTQIIFQTVIVPTNTLLMQYTYLWGSSSSDPADSAEFSALIANSNSIVIDDLDNEFNGNTSGYEQNTYNLTNLAGQSIDVAFEVQLASGVGQTSDFNITDVSLLAFTTADIPPNEYFTNSIVLSNTTNKISVLGTNVVATSQPGDPTIAGNSGGHLLWWNWTAPSNGIVTINTSDSTFKTVLGVYTGTVVSNLTQIAVNDSGTTDSQVKFAAFAGTTYQIAVDGKNGATGIIQLNLSFALDKTPPKITIKSPGSGAKLTNSTVVVTGTASDFVGLASVQVQLANAQGTNAYQDATGTTNWTFTITNLVPGLNTINVQAIDTSDNGTTISEKVTFIVVSPLTVNVNGTGTVSPILTNKLLDVGAPYTITAKPGTGQVFSNWTDVDGVQLATTEAFTFTMESNLVLTANFVPNPFAPLVGGYQGLFYDSINGAQHVSSGFFNVTLSSSGSYSAKVIMAGVNYSLSGQFSAGGVASNNIVRKGLPSVSVQMQLGLDGSGITGVLSDGVWTAQLIADRVATSATTAHYTMVIPGGEDSSVQPGGDSYGTITISSTGSINFSGELADDTKVTQKANLLANGQWPFYIGLYSGNGSIFGWLTFSNELGNDIITGTVNWFKLPQVKAKFYPGGFTNTAAVEGSIYLFTNGVPMLNLSSGNGIAVFSNGNLPFTFANQITLSAANKITDDSTNALTATITTSSGLFKVTATDPTTGKPVSANGVVLQNQNVAGGFFLGTNQSGEVILSPPP